MKITMYYEDKNHLTILEVPDEECTVMVETDYQQRLAVAVDGDSVQRRTVQEILDREINAPTYNRHRAAKRSHKSVRERIEAPDAAISAMVHFKDANVSYEAVVGHCKALLAKCDGIIMTGNWQNSRGCMEEREYAAKSKLDVWESIDAFRADMDMPSDCCGKYSYCRKCLCRECLERLDCWNCNDCEKIIGRKYPIGFTGEDVWECTRYRKRSE